MKKLEIGHAQEFVRQPSVVVDKGPKSLPLGTSTTSRAPEGGDRIVCRFTGIPTPGTVVSVQQGGTRVHFDHFIAPVLVPHSVPLEEGPTETYGLLVGQEVEKSFSHRTIRGIVSGLDTQNVYISWGTPFWNSEVIPLVEVQARGLDDCLLRFKKGETCG